MGSGIASCPGARLRKLCGVLTDETEETAVEVTNRIPNAAPGGPPQSPTPGPLAPGMTRSLRTVAIAFTLLVLAPRAPALAPRAPASIETLDEFRSAARTALVGRLLSLAKWCNENELFEDRDRAWRSVIVVEPDNLEARKGLRFARNADGSWKEPAPRPAKNRNPAALEKLPAKRVEAIGPFSDALLERLQKEEVAPEVRKSVLGEIIAIDPDDEKVHGMLGEARLDGGWVLLETATGKTRRAAIRAVVQAAKDAPAGLDPVSPTAEEKQLFEGWKCGSKSSAVRVLGTGDASQCESLASACKIAGAVFESALSSPPSWADEFTLYIVAGPGEKDAFVAHLPGAQDAQRESLKRTIGGGVPGTWNVVLFEPDLKKRVDCGVRHALAHLLRRSWNIDTRNAWIFEGLGLYLTREICGSRLTWFCSGSGVTGEGKNSPRGRLMVADSNWMNEALKLLTRDPPPDLAAVLGRDIATMGVEDVLVSYALAAYLVEGRPETTPALLKQIGADTASAEALHAVLGLTVPELQERLVRWLKERK